MTTTRETEMRRTITEKELRAKGLDELERTLAWYRAQGDKRNHNVVYDYIFWHHRIPTAERM